MANFIFIDIDGVMNNRRDWMSKVDNKAEQFHDHRMFCDDAWQLLSNTCKKVNASVVLSSSWRLGLTYDENRKVIARDHNCHLSTRLIEYFDKYNIKLVGITVNNWSDRGQQIMEYVSDHLKIEDDFVVVDDESFDIREYVSEDQFIKTEFETGLLPEHCEKIIKYFKED